MYVIIYYILINITHDKELMKREIKFLPTWLEYIILILFVNCGPSIHRDCCDGKREKDNDPTGA